MTNDAIIYLFSEMLKLAEGYDVETVATAMVAVQTVLIAKNSQSQLNDARKKLEGSFARPIKH